MTGPAGEQLRRFVFHLAHAASPVTVSGPGWLVLAWLTGRDAGAALSVAGASRLPRMPAWG